jgi:hypothetical protein
MADSKISQLTSGAPAQAGDEYVIARSGSNFKLTLTNIAGNMPATTISAGNLTFSSTGQRITGDMSNATIANRLAFQTSTTNGNTDLQIIPNGTSVTSGIRLNNNSDTTNAGYVRMSLNSTEASISVDRNSVSGTYLPLGFNTGGSERMRLDTSGNLGIGTASPTDKFQIEGTGTVPVASIRSTTTGSTNQAAFNLFRGDSANGFAQFGVGTTSTNTWQFGLRSGSTSWQLFDVGANAARVVVDTSGNVGIGTASPASKLDVNGIVRDSAGNVRAIPRTGSAKTTSYTLATADVGQFVEIGSGGSVTIPDATFATGDAISVFNNTSGAITITCTITTAYIAGTDADKATVSLATRGVATILFISGTVCVISGNVS